MNIRRAKVIVDQAEVFDVSPELVAEMFTEMGSDEQAQFFNHVAALASKWDHGAGSLAMQLQYITDDDGLTLAGRRVMDGIGEYSHWGLADGRL